MSKHPKKQYQKDQFSDEEILEEIRDEIREIRAEGLKKVPEAERINELYNRRKQEKKKKKMMKEGTRTTHLPLVGNIDHESSD